MTTPNDAARPVLRYQVDNYIYDEQLSPGIYVKAADYDALREEVEELTKAACQAIDDLCAVTARAEAAEAKVAKISEAARLLRDEIVDSQPHGGDHHDEFCPTCQAIRDVDAALNEGDGG